VQRRLRWNVWGMAVYFLIGACGASRAAPTDAAATAYAEPWRGTTSQRTPISFVVSPDQKVTAITVGYRFGNCSGTNTYDGLNLALGTGPNSDRNSSSYPARRTVRKPFISGHSNPAPSRLAMPRS
jgi:hypothetical protein